MTEPKPLTREQMRAAALLGAGLSAKVVAIEVEVATRTVSRWNQRRDFQALVRQQRTRVLDEVPTVRATLEHALTAVRKDGTPDFAIRVQAAKALAGIDGSDGEPEPPRETVINTHLLDAD